jgi:hypothetical protein
LRRCNAADREGWVVSYRTSDVIAVSCLALVVVAILVLAAVAGSDAEENRQRSGAYQTECMLLHYGLEECRSLYSAGAPIERLKGNPK